MKTSKAAAGFVFGCTEDTMDECLRLLLFGSPKSKNFLPLLDEVYLDAPLFLFNYNTRELLGRFAAESKASIDLVPRAFNGRFPVQVRCRIEGPELKVLSEKKFKPILKDNYFARMKFSNCLTRKQVEGLDRLLDSEKTKFYASNRQALVESVNNPPQRICTIPISARLLRDVKALPPHLLPQWLYRRPDTVDEIPFPPSATDRRTTICFGPLPKETSVSVKALMFMLNDHIESKYNFLLVKTYNRERWCYVNFCEHQEVSYFVLDSDKKSLAELSNGLISERLRIKVMYWKWQGIDMLATIFAESGCWIGESFELCTQFYDDRPLFFYGAGAKLANRPIDYKMDGFIDTLST